MKRIAAVILGALLPGLAHADPASIIAAVSAWWATATAATLVTLGVRVAFVVSSVYGSIASRRKARNQAAREKARYNASLEDRTLTLLQAAPPLRVIYGRCIVGGDVVAQFTSDKTGVKEDGTAYTKADAYKHLVIVLAAHEVQAIDDVFVDGVSVGPLDANGWTTTGEFYRASDLATRTVTVPGGSFVDVSPAVVAIIDSYVQVGAGIDSSTYDVTCTLSNGNTRITNPDTSAATVHYTVSTAAPLVKVDKHLGTTTQTVSTYLNSVKPSQWTTNHRLRGLAYVVVTLDLEEPRFQAGPPQLTFDVRGKKVFDTRTSTTAWTENPALIVRDFLTSVYGFGVQSSDIDTAACNAAANACDARVSATTHSHATTFTASASTEEITCAADRWFATGDGVRLTTTGTLPGGLAAGTTYYVIATASRRVFKLATSVANAFAGTAINITSAGSGTHTVTWYDYAAYTCNGAFATDGSGREAALDDLVATMGGQATYGGTWVINAGAWASSVMSLVDDDLDGQIEIVQAGEGLDAIVNGLRGQYVPTGKATPVDFDPYSNATFVAADGRELWLDVNLPFVGNKVRAKNLARILVERARAGLTIRYPAKLKAWPLQVGDRVTVTSAEYGWASKSFRVVDWQFGAGTAVQLTLQEDAASIYDLADAVTADPTPNTGLPNPWIVPAVTGVTVASGTTHLVRAADGTIRTRALVSWNAVTSSYVRSGGFIEVAWSVNGSTSWSYATTTGDATSLYLDGLRDGTRLRIQVRAKNSLGAVGPITAIAHTVVGKTAAPSNVSGLAYTVKYGVVRLTWTQPSDADYAFTEIRRGASWAAGTRIAKIKGSSYEWVDPESGSYALWAKHFDTTGNESATAATLSARDWETLVGRSGANLIGNPEFVDDNGGVTAPMGWTRTVSGTPTQAQIFRTTSSPSYGPPWNRNAPVLYAGVGAPSEWVLWQTDYIPVSVDVNYTLSCWARQFGSNECRVYFGVTCFDATSSTVLGHVYILAFDPLTTTWKRYSGTIGPDGAQALIAGTARVRVRWYGAYNTSGTSYTGTTFATRFSFREGLFLNNDIAPSDPLLVSGSATEVAFASDPYETATLTNQSIGHDLDICYLLNWVNNSNRTVSFLVEACSDGEVTVSSGTGPVIFTWYLRMNYDAGVTVPWDELTNTGARLSLSAGSGTTRFPMSRVIKGSAPPGKSIAVWVRLTSDPAGVAHTWTVTARLTAIRILALKTS